MNAAAAMPEPRLDIGHREVLGWVAESWRPASYLEVGVRDGGSLRAVLAVHHPARLTLCDDWGHQYGGTGRGSHDHVEALLAELGFAGEVAWLDGCSYDLLPELPSSAYDVVHVDGDHSVYGALYDLMEARRLRTRCGAIVAHDLSFSTVARAVRLFGRPDIEFTGDTGTGLWL